MREIEDVYICERECVHVYRTNWLMILCCLVRFDALASLLRMLRFTNEDLDIY